MISNLKNGHADLIMEESNEQGMFTLENSNRYPEGKGLFQSNPSGLRPSRILIGMGPLPSGYRFGFSKVNIPCSLDSSNPDSIGSLGQRVAKLLSIKL